MTDAAPLSFVIDMNLSTAWVGALESMGHRAVHWGSIGDCETPDPEIMEWARANGRVLFTSDLDFGTLLALTHVAGPSVLQIRTDEALPRQIQFVVRLAVDRYRDALAEGALVIVDENKTRVRILPL